MTKSKFLFLVIAIVYICVGVLNCFEILRIGTNIYAALSITALFLSLGDVFEKIHGYLYNTNLVRAEKKVEIDFLNQKLEGNIYSTHLNIRNTIENIKEDDIAISKYVFCHPVYYTKRKHMKTISALSTACFVVGMAAFIILPLVKANIISEDIISVISVFAFSIMMVGMYIDERILEKQVKYNNLVNEKSAIIRDSFADFDAYHGQFFLFINDLKVQEAMNNEK